MYKAVLIVYLGVFGQPNPASDLAMIIPVPTVEKCIEAKNDMLKSIKEEAPVSITYIVECVDPKVLNVVSKQG